MSEHALHFGELCPGFEHAPGQTMPELMRCSRGYGAGADTEVLGPFEIALAGGGFLKLGRSKPSQLGNALTCYPCPDPRHQRSSGHCALHAHEQWGAFLFTANGW